jgi:hypothetical protein
MEWSADISHHVRQLEDYSPDLNRPNFYPPYRSDTVKKISSNIPLKEYCHILAIFIDETRGTSLQGFQASGTQTAIFRQQSAFWDVISKEYVEACYSATMEFLKCAVMHVAGRYTGEKLMRAFLDPSFAQIGSNLEAKLEELLWPYRKSHLSTQNPAYSSRVRPTQKTKSSQDGQESSNGEDEAPIDSSSWMETARRLKYKKDLIFAAETLDTTNAYYEVSILSSKRTIC